ncbi:MAG TPA: hypothetical protein VGD66_12530 [Allosphingosinicella sp.]|jgi:hypothetical protein
MAKKSNEEHRDGSGRSGRYVKTEDSERRPTTISDDTGKYQVKSSRAGMVVGRNAVSGQFVRAPAIKAGAAFRTHKSNLVSEVIKNRRGR